MTWSRRLVQARGERLATTGVLATTTAAAATGMVVANSLALAVALLSAIALVLVPMEALLALSIVMARGLGESASVHISPLTIADVVLLVWLGRQTVALLSRRFTLVVVPWAKPLGALIGWAWLTTGLSGVSLTPLVRLSLYAAVAVVLASTGTSRSFLGRGIVLYGVIEVVVSITQWRGRMIGATVGDPHQLGLLLLAGTAITLAQHVHGNARRRWILLILMAGLVLTGARGIWMATAALYLVHFRARLSRPRLVLIGASLTMAGLFAYGPVSQSLGLNLESSTIRRDSLGNGVQLVLEKPIMGQGWGWTSDAGTTGQRQRVALANTSAQPYNLFLNVAAGLGLPGLFLLLGYLSSLLRWLAERDRAGFLFCSGALILGLSETIWFAGSMGTMLFFLLSSGRTIALRGQPDCVSPVRPTPSRDRAQLTMGSP